MSVVAEGVECEAIARALRAFGCDAAQGYHFARPLPADELQRTWLVPAMPDPHGPEETAAESLQAGAFRS
jgi:predicted signal transduction protein with EAL and GGDEF domain